MSKSCKILFTYILAKNAQAEWGRLRQNLSKCLTHFSPVSQFYTPRKNCDTGLKWVKT